METTDPANLAALAGVAARQLVALAVFAGAAAGVGRLLTRRLPFAGRAEALAVAAAVGMGVLGSALFFVGLAGWLSRGVVLALAAAGGAAAVGALVVGRGMPGRTWDDEPVEVAAPATGGPRPAVALAALAAAFLPAFVWSLFPPTGFDAVTYHLPYARAFVESGRLVAVPELLFPVFPQLAETLAAALLAATGADVVTHLVQLTASAAVALLAWAGGRRFFGPWAGVWAAALWVAHPLVHYQASSAYVDTVLALFCLLAVYGWEVWRERRTAGAGGGGGWLIVAGAAAGWALSTKYLALIWVGALGLVALAAGPRRRRLAGAAALGAIALAVAAPWYARIHHHTGNPVHPFLASFFSGVGETSFDVTVGLAGDEEEGGGAAALAGAAGRALTRPWKVADFAWKASFQPAAFSRQSPLAPWHFALVPLAAVFSWRDRRLLRWLALVLVYLLLWTTHDPRFQLPSMALLAIAGGGAIDRLGRRLPAIGRRLARPAAAWALAVVLALPGPAYAVYKVRRHGPLPPAAPAAREAFLAGELAGYAEIALLDRRHGGRSTVYVFGAPYLTFHSRGRLLGQALGRYRWARVTSRLGDAAALHRELRSMGADHLLVVHAGGRFELPRGPAFDARFRRVAGGERAELYALRPPPPPSSSEAPVPPGDS